MRNEENKTWGNALVKVALLANGKNWNPVLLPLGGTWSFLPLL